MTFYKTGKHYEFEWQATICQRSIGDGCPYLTGRAVWPGYNDLSTTNPELAKEWHPKKNGDLKPSQVTSMSRKKVWWLLKYEDPKTGKHYEFEWQATIQNRNKGVACPYLTGTTVYPGYNDLSTLRPDLAAQWHPVRNGDLTPEMVTVSSVRWVYWYLPFDDPKTGKHYEFEWSEPVVLRAMRKECPFISNRAVWTGYNDLETCFPEIAEEWDFDKNGDRKPQKILKYASIKVWWICKNGHSWYASVSSRTRSGSGCPECLRRRRRYGSWDG